MSSAEETIQHNQLLENLAEALDISPTKYMQAVQRYTTVGNWLYDSEDKSTSKIYVQGSFRLGTIVRPIKESKEADYDIDLVHQHTADKLAISPDKIKFSVGHRLKQHATYCHMLEDEGRRCWTLKYSEQDGVGFHLDILPSVSEDTHVIEEITSFGISLDQARKAVAITDKSSGGTYTWSTSNPNAYAEWFNERQRSTFEKIAPIQRQQILLENKGTFSSIEDIPNALIKTPLQRAIQLLKRHRDIRFLGHASEKDKPISMILTTLAAQIYEGEKDVYSTLKNIVQQLKNYMILLENESSESNVLNGVIKRRAGKWYIPNPVNPQENFADKWHENEHRKARAFFQWLTWIGDDLEALLKNPRDTIGKYFGKEIGDKLMSNPVVISYYKKPPKIIIRDPVKPWGF